MDTKEPIGKYVSGGKVRLEILPLANAFVAAHTDALGDAFAADGKDRDEPNSNAERSKFELKSNKTNLTKQNILKTFKKILV